MEIKKDLLHDIRVIELIEVHLQGMADHSPPESIHALNTEELKQPDITFWTAWDGDELLGCGALKEINEKHGEIKAMRTVSKHVRKGVAKNIVAHILHVSKNRGYERISLETGSTEAFHAARELYKHYGFQMCGPFSDYKEDPNSVFMTRELERQ
ncbi:acetyltransferase [Bacillus coahuilensis m2-6]|uniref:GNAT family N-acetyltransferase n=1 Tax=Bacillus coahuilensis TaxID=408580 RepID=UPI0007503E15|nr:GNAT family N-acetyltransferase [Bacillus coahuilensis]KUP07474.1 acetyltransferase [Bacillus coahuilensis m2-6]